MSRILKVGDQLYSQSIKPSTPEILEGFPQREQFLFAHARGLNIETFRHEVLAGVEQVARERERLSQYLRAQKFDLVMVDNPLSALIIDKTVAPTILFDCIDWYDELYLKEFGVDKRYYLLRYGLLDLLERADKVVAQSPVMLDSLRMWGLRTNQAAVVPNGYDSSLFKPYSPDRARAARSAIQKRVGTSFEDKSIIVYTGKLTTWYEGIKTIAEAITDKQIFLIVGDGPLRSAIPERENVVQVGAVALQEVPDYTNSADVLVYPVDSDCSPIVVSEYLAVGKPVVIPKGRIDWLLTDGQHGCLVDNSIHSWRRGIARALENKDAFGKCNLELAREFSWDKLASNFVDFVRS